MSNNHNLIPTPVVNKNGVATTVYKKPEVIGVVGRSIPAPTPSAESSLVRLSRMVINHLMPSRVRRLPADLKGFEKDRDKALSTLARFPEELQDDILFLMNNDDEDETHRITLVYSLTQGAPESFFNEYVAYNQFLTRDNYCRLLNGLRQYPQLPKVDDYSAVPERTREQITALLNVTEEVLDESRFRIKLNSRVRGYDHGLPVFVAAGEAQINYNGEAAVLTEKDLVQLILDHPEKSDQIKRIIIDRNTGDAELIRDIITTSAPAISEGTL